MYFTLFEADLLRRNILRVFEIYLICDELYGLQHEMYKGKYLNGTVIYHNLVTY